MESRPASHMLVLSRFQNQLSVTGLARSVREIQVWRYVEGAAVRVNVSTALRKQAFSCLDRPAMYRAEGPNPFGQQIASHRPDLQLWLCCSTVEKRSYRKKELPRPTTMPEPCRYLTARSGALASGRAIQDLTCKAFSPYRLI